MNGRLYRSRAERVIAGVAGGLADYLDVDPSLVRVVWVILALFSGGAFLLIYIVMALVVPEEPWEGFVPPPTPGMVPPPTPGMVPPPTPGMVPPPPGMSAPASADAGQQGTTAADTGASATATPPPPVGQWPAGTDWRAQRAAWRAQRRAQRAAWRASGHGHESSQTAGLVFGLLLLVVGIVFLVPIAFPAFDVGRFWPVLLIGLGVVLVIAAMSPRRSPGP